MNKETNVPTLNVSASVKEPKYIPVCIAEDKMYLKPFGKETPTYNVIQYVCTESLAELRSEESVRALCKEVWKDDVASDLVECSLDEYLNDWDEKSKTEANPEYYPAKDTRHCDVFNEYPGLREYADCIIKETMGEDVGTWESAGYLSYGLPEDEEIKVRFNIQ